MTIRNRREKRWGERNMGGCIWGLIIATMFWAVIVLIVVTIIRAR